MADEPVRGSLLDFIGMDQAKLTALAEGVGLDMLGKMEPAIVQWVNDHAAATVQSLLDGMEPALSQWITDNAAPAVQSLIDALRASLSPPPAQ